MLDGKQVFLAWTLNLPTIQELNVAGGTSLLPTAMILKDTIR